MRHWEITTTGQARADSDDPWATERKTVVGAETEEDAKASIAEIEQQLADYFNDDPWTIFAMTEIDYDHRRVAWDKRRGVWVDADDA